MAEPRGRPSPARGAGSPRLENALPPIQIRYYKRMRLQRVYSVVVNWYTKKYGKPPAGAGPVTFRLLMAGAQVLPSELTLDPAKSDAKATFHVTPLAKGWLHQERLEVLQNGKKVQEIPLRCKVVSQALTKALLLLTFVVPWFILSYFKYSPLQETKETPSRLGKMMTTTTSPGDLLEKRLRDNLPSLPKFKGDKGILPGDDPWDPPEFVRDGAKELRKFPKTLGSFYEDLCRLSHDIPLAFFVGCKLLFLTFCSWLLHNDKRKKRLGKPIPVPRGDSVGATTMPARRGQPVGIED